MHGSVAEVSYNLRFPGQYYQAETGLNQNVNRDYDPLIGRYIESDPILQPRRDGIDSELIFAVPYLINRGAGFPLAYAYIADQPTLMSDPEGLNPFTFAWDFIKCMHYSNKYLKAVQDCKGRCGNTTFYQLNFIAAYNAPDLDTAVFKCACQNAGVGVCWNMFKSCGKAANGAPSMAPLGPLVE